MPIQMEQRSPSFDSVVGSPRSTAVVVQNNHALVSSASAAGKAKSMLPVVSTLIFGLAANLAPTTSQPMSFFFAVSAACSLYTTTYAVLPCIARAPAPYRSHPFEVDSPAD